MRRVYAYAVICERILVEANGLTSLIRVADVFKGRLIENVAIESLAVPVSVYVSVRTAEPDDQVHTVRLMLVRPSGEEKSIGETYSVKFDNRFPNAPSGVNLVLQFGVLPTQWGTHEIRVIFDEEEVTQSIFTLVQVEEPRFDNDSALSNQAFY